MANLEINDLYQQITDKVINALSNATDWVKPWYGNFTGTPRNVITQKEYAGVNVISLWIGGQSYSSLLWGTYKQWQSLGAQVRKGEKAQTIVFYKNIEQVEQEENNKEDQDTVKRFILKSSAVFNAEQVDGFAVFKDEPQETFSNLEKADDFILKTAAKITHGSSAAFYQPAKDLICVPDKSNFISTDTSTALESYYATLLHELGHWTGHQNRLNRIVPAARFGSESYAVEELIAELASAFLCAKLGVSSSPRQDHANYLASWLKVLKKDKRAIFYAARQATVAMEYLNNLTKE
jgi:antirestriction protein ArdC